MSSATFAPHWALAAAALAAKAAGRHCGPGVHGPGFGWMFGAGPWGGHGPWGRGGAPWGGWAPGQGTRARKGNIRAAILTLLAEEPANGYQLIQRIGERSGGAWRPSPGAVYPALQQLADEGLIRAAENEGRKTYSLTDAGRAYVAAHAEELNEPWAQMTPEYGEGVPDLLKQAARTGAAVMQIVHAGSPEQVAQAAQVLADARSRLYRILAEDDPEE
ncbi:PadR family transcriptional regulator [Thermomonospora curvata]|uniref:Transcriptional regulator, PadR-like family n=1 Tax=Thermomonospora curvata (strain ATCC 19995 / DSM 43183 / JCM 3096 / KCTC 9072 / NBRC 15933 / NCIMB 10081 / Henssen B9) TaxID=471852 RepID=D1AC56_THECD|nr:PadR family transcriptional regulator [Thermomonospora curvata]ACY97322.1 transcriptional regulator, PadR-like family [Thermomonospora curvata DSM 43183]